MPTNREINAYLSAAVTQVSGEPPKWPFPRIRHGHGDRAGHYYLYRRLEDARNTYRKETGFKQGRNGRNESQIPVHHAVGILSILRSWSTNTKSPRGERFPKAGLTEEAIDLAIAAIQEDFED